MVERVDAAVRQRKEFNYKDIWLSKSGVHAYNQCPFRFYHQVVLGTPFVKSIEMFQGNIAHDLIFEVYDNIDREKIDSSSDLRREYWDFFAKRLDDIRKEDAQLGNNLGILLNKFITVEEQRWGMRNLKYPNRFWPKKKEMFLEDDEIKYYGTLDRLDKWRKGKYILLDYKTGKYREYNLSKMRNEMFGYKHLVEANGIVKGEVTHWGQIFLGGVDTAIQPQVISEPFKSATEKAFYKKLEKTRKGIKFRFFPKKHTPLCDWCSYVKECMLEAEDKWKEPE